MATSPAQLIANQQNAQRSTGPRSTEGKARSSQNARKHSLTSRDIIVAREDRPEFVHFLRDLESEIAPTGALQQALFNELVCAAWNLRRIRRMEVELTAQATAKDLFADGPLQTQLERLARHKTRIERTFHRCLKEIRSLQTNRVIHETLPDQLKSIVPPLANAKEISKRTQSIEDPPGPVLLRWSHNETADTVLSDPLSSVDQVMTAAADPKPPLNG